MYNLLCGCWRGVGEIVNNDSHLGCPPRLCLRCPGEVLVQAPGGLLLAAEVTPHPARAPAQAGGHPSTGHLCFKKVHPKVRNHGEGPYSGLLLVESGYYRFHI